MRCKFYSDRICEQDYDVNNICQRAVRNATQGSCEKMSVLLTDADYPSTQQSFTKHIALCKSSNGTAMNCVCLGIRDDSAVVFNYDGYQCTGNGNIVQI